MAKSFSGQAANGTTDPVRRVGGKVTSGLFVWKKSGSGTGNLYVKNSFNDKVVSDDFPIALTTATDEGGTVEFALPAQSYHELADVSGTVSVDSVTDGADS